MPDRGAADSQETPAFWNALEAELAACPTVEAAAQLFCERFYAAYSSFAALVRVFITLRYDRLGDDDRRFVDDYLVSAAHGGVENASTVLTMLGTSGIEPQWNDRAQSRDHRAIPLLSDAFIAEAPMIARLLGDIGFVSRTAQSSAWQYVTKDALGADGLFFVGDARSATDERGRRIIPAISFVERYGVRTVFGFGGPYPDAPEVYLTAIVFTRAAVDRATRGAISAAGRALETCDARKSGTRRRLHANATVRTATSSPAA